jgi:hypothetical protein
MLFLHTSIQAQSFTKVTDSDNPVVNDQYESGGGSWADLNHDGYLDLFVANGNLNSQNNSLYLNRRDGNFIKVRAGAVVNDGGSSIGGTWGDHNGDGEWDLFVTNRNFFGNLLYLGAGDSTFVKITEGSLVTDRGNSNSSSWVDIENDGDLDLVVINFEADDYLYLNNGAPDYTFTKIDTAAFLHDNSSSIPGAWADFDNDRDQDLFVGNAGAQDDFLYVNNGNGAFAKIVFPDGRSTLGASWGDFDNDGDLDLFTANFLQQNNILYRSSGPPLYALSVIDAGSVSNDGGSSVGSAWGDYDNDGDLDLFAANFGQDNFLYRNNGAPDYSFTKITSAIVATEAGSSFGCSWADFDRDGDLDLFVANQQNQKNFLYTNDGNSSAWLNIRGIGTISNTTAIGTKVRVRAVINGSPRWQMQEVLAQSGYNSQNPELHFGLGDAAIIDSIIVEWPRGAVNTFTNVGVNQHITITENGTVNSVLSDSDLRTHFILFQNYPNPFNPATTIRYRLPQAQFVTLKIYDLLGRELGTIVNAFQTGGIHEAELDAARLTTSGVYFYRLTAGSFIQMKKMLFVR